MRATAKCVPIVLLLIQSIYPSAASSKDCLIPRPQRRALVRHLKWSDFWRGTGYLPPSRLTVTFAQVKDRRVWYVKEPKMVFVQYFGHGRESALEGESCFKTPQACIRERLSRVTSEPTIAERLLGGLPAQSFDGELNDTTCELDVENVGTWERSPYSEKKQQILTAVAKEVQRVIGDWGRVENLRMNDFNIEDPGFFIRADLIRESGDQERLYLGIHVSNRSSNAIQFATWRVFGQAERPRSFQAKMKEVGTLPLGLLPDTE